MFRRRATKSTIDASSSPRCVMCGVEVIVDDGGFCPLGHFVGVVQATVDAYPEPARRAEPEPGAVFTEPTIPMPVLDGVAAGGQPTMAIPVVDDEVPAYTGTLNEVVPAYNGGDESGAPERDSLESLAALFGAELVDPEITAEEALVPASFEPSAASYLDGELPSDAEDGVQAEAQHALDELLAHSHMFTADAETEAAFSALDVAADSLATEDPVQGDDEPAAFESIAAPEDDVDDAVAARRRAAGLLGGSVLTLALLAGSFALLPV